MSDFYTTSVPTVVPSHDWYDIGLTPSSFVTMYVPACHGVSTDTATVSVVQARASVPTFGGPQQSLMCPTVQPSTATSTSMLSIMNMIPVPTQHSTPGLAAPPASTGIDGLMFNLPPPNVSSGLVQPQVVSSVAGSVAPTAAVSVSISSVVPTPLDGTTAVIASPSAVNVNVHEVLPPPVVAATVASAVSVWYAQAPNLASSIAITQPVNIVPAVAPSSSIAYVH